MFVMFCNVFQFHVLYYHWIVKRKQGEINVWMIYTLLGAQKKEWYILFLSREKEKNPSPRSPCVSLGSSKLCPSVRTKVPAGTCEVLPGATSGFNAWENWGDNIFFFWAKVILFILIIFHEKLNLYVQSLQTLLLGLLTKYIWLYNTTVCGLRKSNSEKHV